jgi:hypothetical protein
MKQITLLFVSTFMLFASIAYAGPREDWHLLADSIEVSGNLKAAESIRQAVGALSDEDLQRVYGDADLVGLASQFSTYTEVTQKAVTRFPELGSLYRTPAPVTGRFTVNTSKKDKGKSSILTAGLPPAEGYPTPGWCPFSPNRSDSDALLIAQDVTAGARVLLEAAKVLWSGLSRGCDETVVVAGFGGNVSLACIPADVVLFAAELVVGAAETVVEHIAFCDSSVDSSEIEGSFERISHVHSDLEIHEAALATHDTDIKALLGSLQDTVDENQRLIKISMSRQLDIMRLLIMPSGRREINEDVLTCTGDDCPVYPALQLCPNGSLMWNCGDNDKKPSPTKVD